MLLWAPGDGVGGTWEKMLPLFWGDVERWVTCHFGQETVFQEQRKLVFAACSVPNPEIPGGSWAKHATFPRASKAPFINGNDDMWCIYHDDFLQEGLISLWMTASPLWGFHALVRDSWLSTYNVPGIVPALQISYLIQSYKVEIVICLPLKIWNPDFRAVE